MYENPDILKIILPEQFMNIVYTSSFFTQVNLKDDLSCYSVSIFQKRLRACLYNKFILSNLLYVNYLVYLSRFHLYCISICIIDILIR